MSDKPVIFISFSHKDEPEPPVPGEVGWLSFVQSFLAPLVVAVGIFDIWVDFHLHGGDKIDPEIEKKLAACDIFVLLVSRHSLASPYVVQTEIATIHARQKNGEDVHLFPIALSPVPNAALALLEGVLLKPDIKRPLSLMSPGERDVAMAAIADDIAAVAKEMAEKKRALATDAVEVLSPLIIKKVDSLAVAIGEEVTTAIEAFERDVDIKRLPETAYERLVGREAQLARLDEAWADSKTNILSLVAEGGAGKSALVNEWLTRLQTDSYRGADAVLGWSFYSQGSKERATSAEGFLNWALEKLGIRVQSASASASVKGEAIADALAKRRVLLVIDGVEPLQHGPGPQVGQLKDLGLRSLLRRFAFVAPAETHGLIVLTSRLAVADIARWKDTAAPVDDVERLFDEAGAALLRDNGVWGTDRQLKTAAHEFGGHPLALSLLATFLKETQLGDVRRRDRIRGLVENDDNPLHAHARRMMASYEDEWLKDQPVLLAILYMVGLFDRPASGDCLLALRRAPVIQGLTDDIVKLDDAAWNRAVARLREVRLLAPLDRSALDVLDAHPLVREWFGERLKATNETAWRAAHGRLYGHLRDTTKEGNRPTLESLAPLYQAIGHGCRAGRSPEALNNIFRDRIFRWRPDGYSESYSHHILGAVGSNLAALGWFFETPYSTPTAALSEADKVWVMGEAAFCLRCQGRFLEAISGEIAALDKLSTVHAYEAAARVAANLSESQLAMGHISDAIESQTRSIEFADRATNATFQKGFRASLAYATYIRGDSHRAKLLFDEASRRHAFAEPNYPIMYSIWGYYYADFLLSRSEGLTAFERSMKVLEWEIDTDPLLDRAVARLAVGRALHGLALWSEYENALRLDIRSRTQASRRHISDSVDNILGANSVAHTPTILLARAAFLRSIGDWYGATRDLDEVEEIAEPGPMRLHLCDMALERARLAFAQIEAFAPLNGMLEEGQNPPKPEVPDTAKIAELKAQAGKQIKIADDYIQSCGYHRRDEELVELQAVLRGEKTFASLPPRV